jgi:hypothetical protein
MIDFALKENRVKRYRHAARHLIECAALVAPPMILVASNLTTATRHG